LKLSQKPQHWDKCQFNCVRLNLIWYHFILNLEIRAWNLYFLNENVLHLNNKNKPCFLTRIIDFLSPKVEALLFLNSQIGVFAFAKISCSDKLAAMSVQRYWSFFSGSSLLSESVHMYMYIFKTERRNKSVREKSDIKKTGMELWRNALLFLYPLELFNRGKGRISWLFYKKNSLNIA